MIIKRRDFISLSGRLSIGLAGINMLPPFSPGLVKRRNPNKVTVDNAVATLEDGTVFKTPYWRIDSGKDGHSLLLISAQHGNEVQGTEVARRFKEICSAQLVKGSVWLIPMAELRGIRVRRYTVESLPEKRIADKAFHKAWPGDPNGNDTERIAYSLDQAVVRHCSHAMDMHCWAHINAAGTLAEEDKNPSRALGDVTTTRVISYKNTSMPVSEKMIFSQLMFKRGVVFTVMELSGQYQMQQRQVQIGLSSMVNIAKVLGMINGEPILIKGKRAVQNADTTHEVKAPCSGIFMPSAGKDKMSNLIPDDYVEKGQVLGHIIRDKDLEMVMILSPVSGYLSRFGPCHWGLCDASLPAQHPYTEEGETIAIVVTV